MILCAALYVIYRLVDPLPPRHLVIAAGMPGSGYENIAKRYGRMLARHGVELEIRNSAGAIEDLNLLRDPASRVQAALTTFGVFAATFPVTTFRNVELLVVVIFNVGTVLIAPTISFSKDATWVH